MYVVIDALEADLRRLLRDYVLPYNTLATALGDLDAKARGRASDDGAVSDDVDLLDYLDLGDEVAVLNRQRSFLTADDGAALRACNESLQCLIPIRNRVMHGRPLATADPDDVATSIATIVGSGLTAIRLRDVQTRLQADPDWHPVAQLDVSAGERILHNLPLPDYDETGLLGRQREINRLTSMLLRTDRDNVVTLVGQGGVGKTALAVESLYQLITDPACPYEAVLWTSLKTEELTGEGVRKLAGAIDSLIEPPRALVDEIDVTGEPTWAWIGQALAGVPTLLVIDNVESTDANEIIDIYDQLPSSTSLLLTSRVGLGQLERRVEIGPLSDADGERLLRLYARRRGADHLASLDRGRVGAVASKLRNVPLALKWYVMALEAGAQPEEALADQTELLRFCVDSVVGNLTASALTVAEALFAVGAPIPFGELTLLVDFSPDDLRDAIHALQRSALVEVQATAGQSLGHAYGLTETFSHYMRVVRSPDDALISRVRDRASELRKAEERRQQYVSTRSLDPGSVHCRGESDHAAAFLLGKALRASFRDDVDEALSFTEQAGQLGRSYFEVPRVRAFVFASAGRILEATQAYEDALALAEADSDRAVVSYFFGGHLLRAIGDTDRALVLLSEANETLGEPETAVELARGLTFAHRFDEATDLLTNALPNAVGRTRLIALTARVDLCKRAAEDLLNEQRLPLAGFAQSLAGVRIGLDAIDAGALDLRLSDTVMRCLTEGLRCIAVANDVGAVEAGHWEEVGEALRGATVVSDSWRASRHWPHLERQLGRLATVDDLAESVAAAIQDLLGEDERGAERGSVKFYDHSRGYGFLTSMQDHSDVFFHQSDLRSEDDVLYLVEGTIVAYSRDVDEEQRVCARGVSIDPLVDRDRIGQGRQGHIPEHGLKPRYAFIEDRATHCAVFVHRGSLAHGLSWSELAPEARVRFDVEIGSKGPIATDGSVSLA